MSETKNVQVWVISPKQDTKMDWFNELLNEQSFTKEKQYMLKSA